MFVYHLVLFFFFLFFFFNDTAPTEIYTLSLHDALPICPRSGRVSGGPRRRSTRSPDPRSEEHTSELQSREKLVCRLLLEKKKEKQKKREPDEQNNYSNVDDEKEGVH